MPDDSSPSRDQLSTPAAEQPEQAEQAEQPSPQESLCSGSEGFRSTPRFAAQLPAGRQPSSRRLLSPFGDAEVQAAAEAAVGAAAEGGAGAAGRAWQGLSLTLPPVPSAASSLPLASPFDQASAWGSSPASSLPTPGASLSPTRSFSAEQQQGPTEPAGRAAPPRKLLPFYRQSMLRLRTGLSHGIAEAAARVLEQRQRQRQRQQQPVEAQVGEEAEEGEAEHRRAPAAPDSPSAGGAGGEEQEAEGVRIRLAQRYHPMLTPSGCAAKLPITPQEAASIYTGEWPAGAALRHGCMLIFSAPAGGWLSC